MTRAPRVILHAGWVRRVPPLPSVLVVVLFTRPWLLRMFAPLQHGGTAHVV
jgi:hypothetical protein